MYKKIFATCLFLFLVITLFSSPVAADDDDVTWVLDQDLVWPGSGELLGYADDVVQHAYVYMDEFGDYYLTYTRYGFPSVVVGVGSPHTLSDAPVYMDNNSGVEDFSMWLPGGYAGYGISAVITINDVAYRSDLGWNTSLYEPTPTPTSTPDVTPTATSSVTPTPTSTSDSGSGSGDDSPYVSPYVSPDVSNDPNAPNITVVRNGYNDTITFTLNGLNSTINAWDPADGLIYFIENTNVDVVKVVPNYVDYKVWIYQNGTGYTWEFSGTLANSDLLFSVPFTHPLAVLGSEYGGHRLTCKLEDVSISPFSALQKKYNLELTTGSLTSNLLISKLTGSSRPWQDVVETQVSGTWTDRLTVQNGAYYRAVITTGSYQSVFYWNETGLLDLDPVYELNPDVGVTPTPVSTFPYYQELTPAPLPSAVNNSTAWNLAVPISFSLPSIDFDNLKLPSHSEGTGSLPTRAELIDNLTNSGFADSSAVSWWFGIYDYLIAGVIFVISFFMVIAAAPFNLLYTILYALFSLETSLLLTIETYLLIPNHILSSAFALVPVPVQNIMILGMLIDAIFLFARLILGIKVSDDDEGDES